jgi:hypothetical protein
MFLLLNTSINVVNIAHCGVAAALSRHGHQCTGKDICIIILTSHDCIVCHITVGVGGLKRMGSAPPMYLEPYG